MRARFCSWWKQIKQHLVTILVVAIILVIAVALIIVGYRFDWTGFNGNNKSGKTLWDWLQLLGVLAIPIVVGIGTAFFTRQQAKTSEANVENQQQEELLRTYFDKISELVLNSELSTNHNIESIVRARTLAALHILNATRKGIVLQFLHDLKLLQHVKRYLFLLDLSNTQLIRINLHKADLYKANLREADLREADLGEADLRGADLRGTDLRGTDLSAADLSGATVSIDQLLEAKSLQDAIMPDGSIHQ